MAHPREMAIDVINALQDHYGYFSDEALAQAADLLGMSPLELDELATFYTFIYREPVGRYVIHVCDSLICWMENGENLVAHLCDRLGIRMGETTADGLFTLLPVCCIGYCDRAPAILVDRKVHGPLTIDIPRPADRHTSGEPFLTATYPQVLLKHRKPDRITTLAEYREAGGYEALRRVLTEMDRQEVKTRLADALLLGRGGAGFPAGIKVQTVADDAPFPRYMVCNADEMEPGTFKDRVFLHAEPHMLIEGMTLAAYSIKASHGIIFIRPEYESAARILEREIGIARREGLLGKGILDSDYDFEIVVHRSGGRYICGEVTAQINALQGIRPNPKQPPPYPTDKGLWGKPTLVNNVETLACIPHIVKNGAQWFKDLALSPDAAGTKLFCVSGRVNQPGCYELPLGHQTLGDHRDLLRRHEGRGDVQGLPAGRRINRVPDRGPLPYRDGFRFPEKGAQPFGNRRYHGV